MASFQVRQLNESDRDWVIKLIREKWRSTKIVTRGRIHQADTLPGFVAVQGNKRIGLITYHIDGDECEIVTLDSLAEEMGVGSSFVTAVKNVAASAKCKRLWLVTTNDNLAALHFYQKRGFSLVAVYPNAIEKSRKVKPNIPKLGADGIPIRDEIELELILKRLESPKRGIRVNRVSMS